MGAFKVVDEVDGCVPCTCGKCSSARDAMLAHRSRVEEGIAKLLDSKQSADLHNHPLMRALVAEQVSKQRIGLVVTEYLAGKATREALSFVILSEMGAKP